MVKKLRRIGDSYGIVIPRSMLQACGMEGQVEVAVVGKMIVLTRAEKKPREGWEKQFQKTQGDETTTETDFFKDAKNDFDKTEWTW